MATRKTSATNNHLQEAMALLIRNQAAFVEQIARNDQERLALQRRSDEWQFENKEWQRKNDERWRKLEEWQRKMEEWQRKSDERFDRIEADLIQLPNNIVQTILDQLPRIKKEIGFKSP
jgi:benzoyl-CoA reductase/2-hydroxyglutaryl-CoA dehydratase subunit BcrC/BadD/HgdB